MAVLLDGKKYSQQLLVDLAGHIKSNVQDMPPGLAVVQVGDCHASSIYVNSKARACERVGIRAFRHHLLASVTQQELLDLVISLNKADDVHGILVQLPLPEHIDVDSIIKAIDPLKDVDGFHPYNIGLLAQKKPLLQPCTPYGIGLLLAEYGCSLSGLDVVVVGASNIVGRPAALGCLLAGATVTICHSLTRDLASHVRRADCLIVAVGNSKIVDARDIKPGAIVVDVGINRDVSGKVVGDLDQKLVSQVASFYTPVPGGVGPMTVASLMINTWQSYKLLRTGAASFL